MGNCFADFFQQKTCYLAPLRKTQSLIDSNKKDKGIQLLSGDNGCNSISPKRTQVWMPWV